jgi:hypothetical protein
MRDYVNGTNPTMADTLNRQIARMQDSGIGGTV